MRQLTIILFSFLFFTSYSQTITTNHSSLSQLMEEAYLPGLSLVTIKDGEIDGSHHLGLRSVDTDEVITTNTVFSGASLSKCVFAVIVMQLVEEGNLDLDHPLMNYYSYNDIVHDERSKKVTARMVLSHTTGLPNWRNEKLDFKRDPGEKFGYSGEGFVWLQRTVEHISGKSLENLARERIFHPLGMNRTSYIFLDEFENDYAVPHNREMNTNAKYKIKEANAAHSLQTTARDYAIFLTAIVNHELLNPSTTELMLTPQVDVDKNEMGKVMWGLGFGLQKSNEKFQFWHWGDNGTFKAYFTVNIDNKEGLVYFVNSSNGLSMSEDIVSMYLTDPQPAIQWNDYLYYQQPRFKLHVKTYNEGISQMISSITNSSGKLDTNVIKLRDAKRLASEWSWRGKLHYACPLTELLYSSFPEDKDITFMQAKNMILTGKRNQAIPLLQNVIEKNPENKKVQALLQQLTETPGNGTFFYLRGFQDAKIVSVVGSFNNWDELANIAYWENGAWHCYIDLTPGEYEYKFRIDGTNILDPTNSKSKHKGQNHVSILNIE